MIVAHVTRMALRVLPRLTLILIAVNWNGCAATSPESVPSNAEINKGKMLPDAPGEAGEAAPKGDRPQSDPSAPGAKKSTDTAKAPAAGEMTINFDWVNVRSGPGMKFDVVKKIKKGTKVQVSGNENGIWSKIGEKEYVADKYVSK